MPRTKEPTRFHRLPIQFAETNLAAIDRAAIEIRQRRARNGRAKCYASRSAILNKLIECADFEQIIEELSR